MVKLLYIKRIEDIGKYNEYIPKHAILDVKSRLGDYALSNGKIEDGDPYLKQQLRYLDNFVKIGKRDERSKLND